jgi:hypothetical protein
MPDWEILSRILRKLRRRVFLSWCIEDDDIDVEDLPGLARAIHGHPMISGFGSGSRVRFADLNVSPWWAALATLPYLERIHFGPLDPETEDELVLLNLEPLEELLRAPALRFVRFIDFCFTDALCHAIATALQEGSSIVDITFDYHCEFPDGGRAIITNALKRNASVTDVKFLDDCDEPLSSTLAASSSQTQRCRTLLYTTPHGTVVDGFPQYSSPWE